MVFGARVGLDTGNYLMPVEIQGCLEIVFHNMHTL